MAEDAQGHSPKAERKKIDIEALAAKQEAAATKEGAQVRQLPAKPISLSMRQADLKAVLRAMARIAELNLLIRNDVKAEVSVDFRQVPWNEAFTSLLKTYGLSYIWEGKIIRVMTHDDIDRDLKQKMSMRDIKWVEPLLQPVVINIDYADAKKLADTLQDFLTKDKDGKPRGSVKVDEHSNSLVISAMRDDLAKMLPVIESLDKATPQVLIRANIVETTKGVARDLGMLWGGMYKRSVDSRNLYITPGGTSGTGDPLSGAYTPTASASPGISAQGFAANFPASNLATSAAGSLGLIFGTLGANLLEVQLQALQKDNKLNILSSPSITTLDNQKAFTENGQRVPFITTTTSTAGGTPTQTVTFEEVVLRLEITPHVIDGKNLKMKILVKKDELDFTRAASMMGNPIIIKKQTDTSLIVQDGETIVISGLTKQTLSEGEAGWPLLKDIPALGWLFKSDSKSDSMEEILIFITPKILQVKDYRENALSQHEGNVIKTEAGKNNN